MKMLQLYNQYRSLRSGEERVVYDIMALMEKKGVETRLLMRTSRGLEKTLVGKFRAFFSGIYSTSAYHEMMRVLKEYKPDVVHVNNLYPLFSPSVLVACRKQNIPTVMTIQNYGFTCPIANHLYKSHVCEQCLGGREYWCILKNCRENLFESLAYALRSAVARKLRLFYDNVTLFIAPTNFTKDRLVKAGFQEDRIVLLRNMLIINDSPVDSSQGRYVAFAGRMSPEKGLDILLAAARRLHDVPVRLAGDGPILPQLIKMSTPNTNFVGLLGDRELEAFYRDARFLVVPSRWFEMCPLVISQAVSHGLPIIASRIGGLPEIVEDGVTGLLFEPGNSEDLAHKIQMLWGDPKLCKQMGQAGYGRAINELGEDIYFTRLMDVYRRAIEISKNKNVNG